MITNRLKMENTKKILIGLDFSKMDEVLIQYTKNLNLIFRPDSIYFVNIHKKLDVPAEIQEEFPELEENIDKKYIEKLVSETSNQDIFGCDIHYRAMSGDPIQEIIKLTIEEKIDLVVVGRKSTTDDHGLVHRKLVRKAPCDVLVIPKQPENGIKNIQVATDFSDNSLQAIHKAKSIADKFKGDVFCQHVYTVPVGFYKTGKSYVEFAEIMKNNAKKEYEKIVAPLNSSNNIHPTFTLSEKQDFTEKILTSAEDSNADLIIIGAKGKSGFASMLLGSISESVIEHIRDVPVYITKTSSEVIGFWETFKHL